MGRHRPARAGDARPRSSFDSQVEALALTPDGRQVFAAAGGNVVQHRYVDVEDAAHRICAIAYPRITPAQWQKYLPDLPYQRPC